jgi:hypothetical protein
MHDELDAIKVDWFPFAVMHLEVQVLFIARTEHHDRLAML